MGICLKRFIKFVLCMALLLSCFQFKAFKQVAFAEEHNVVCSQSSSESNNLNDASSAEKVNTEGKVLNNSVDELTLMHESNTSFSDPTLWFGNPLNWFLGDIWGMLAQSRVNNVCETLLDSFFGFLFGKKENVNPYEESKKNFDTIYQNLRSLEGELTSSFNQLGMTTQKERVVNLVNQASIDLCGISSEQKSGGIMPIMDNCIKQDTQFKQENNIDNLDNIYQNLQTAASLCDLDCPKQLYDDYTQLWAIARTDTGESSLMTLYKACLKAEPNPEHAKNMFSRIFCTYVSTLLTINQVMYFSNSARIEQLRLVVDNWDHFQKDGKYDDMCKEYIETYKINQDVNDKTHDSDGFYIKRSRGILKDRQEIANKMSELYFEQDITPCISVTAQDKTDLFHSIGEAWVFAMKTENPVIELRGDVVAYRQAHDVNFYGEVLESPEDMLSSFVGYKPDDLIKRQYFKDGNLMVPHDKNVTINLAGNSLGNVNSPNPVVSVEGRAKLTIDSQIPVGRECHKEYSQIDGVAAGNEVTLNISNTQFNNVMDCGHFRLVDGKEDYVIDRKSKILNTGLVNVKVDNTMYGNKTQVNVNNCTFKMDDISTLGSNVAGAIRMDSDISEIDRTELSVNSSTFENCVSRRNGGGGIFSPNKIKVENSTFKNCLADNGNGGAIYHTGKWNKDSQTSLDATVLKNNKFYSNKTRDMRVGESINEQTKNENMSACDMDSADYSNTNKLDIKKGGAVYNVGFLKLEGPNEFDSNESSLGGAICNERYFGQDIVYGQLLFFGDGPSNFVNNYAKDGGAINTDSNLTISSGATFKKNQATNNGGAINMWNGGKLVEQEEFHAEINFCGDRLVRLEENSATNGGAIWSQRDINSYRMTARENIAEENGAIFMANDSTLKLCNENTISFNSALRDCGAIKGRLSVTGYVNISDNVLKDQLGKTYQESNAVIPKEGLYIEGLIKEFSKIHISTNSNKNFKITDDKSNESEREKCDISWKKRLEEASEMISIDRPNQETKKSCLKTGRHGFHHVYWLEG